MDRWHVQFRPESLPPGTEPLQWPSASQLVQNRPTFCPSAVSQTEREVDPTNLPRSTAIDLIVVIGLTGKSCAQQRTVATDQPLLSR